MAGICCFARLKLSKLILVVYYSGALIFKSLKVRQHYERIFGGRALQVSARTLNSVLYIPQRKWMSLMGMCIRQGLWLHTSIGHSTSMNSGIQKGRRFWRWCKEWKVEMPKWKMHRMLYFKTALTWNEKVLRRENSENRRVPWKTVCYLRHFKSILSCNPCLKIREAMPVIIQSRLLFNFITSFHILICSRHSFFHGHIFKLSWT